MKTLLKGFILTVIITMSLSTFAGSAYKKTANISESQGQENTSVKASIIENVSEVSEICLISSKADSLPNTAGKTYYTTVSLNMRKGASTKHSVIMTIPKGKAVVQISASGKWFKISYNGKSGYVSSSYLSVNKPVVSKQVSSKYKSNSIYVMGKTLPYKNGGISNGQSIIDRSIGTVSTWGGASTWSGTDGKNTHFIGHSHGSFKGLGNVAIGSKIIVTDGSGNPTTYKVNEKFIVDDQANWEGVSYYDYIAGTSGGEIITLQTCRTSTTNWILRATKIS